MRSVALILACLCLVTCTPRREVEMLPYQPFPYPRPTTRPAENRGVEREWQRHDREDDLRKERKNQKPKHPLERRDILSVPVYA